MRTCASPPIVTGAVAYTLWNGSTGVGSVDSTPLMLVCTRIVPSPLSVAQISTR